MSVRVRWTVVLWGERAADNPDHSIAGHGDTPKEALLDALDKVAEKLELVDQFREAAATVKL